MITTNLKPYQVFSQLIMDLLRDGPKAHNEIALQIKQQVPHLCDDSIICAHKKTTNDPEWNHILRSAEQGLKKKKLIINNKDLRKWELISSNQNNVKSNEPIKILQLLSSGIKLNEETHSYYLPKSAQIKFSSVTSIVNEQFPPFEKEMIAKTLVSRVPKYSHLTWEELVKEWENTAKHGTAVHNELENYINDKIEPTLLKSLFGKECFINEIMNYGDKFYPEVIVFSKDLEIAGTIDLLVFNSEKNECYIFDWKTSKKIDKTGRGKGITIACSDLKNSKYNQYSLQLSLYSYILEKYHEITVKEHFIIHLLDDEYNIIKGVDLSENVKIICAN